MNREIERNDLIDLGIASIDTRGGPIGFEDEEDTLQVKLGLADD